MTDSSVEGLLGEVTLEVSTDSPPKDDGDVCELLPGDVVSDGLHGIAPSPNMILLMRLYTAAGYCLISHVSGSNGSR